MVVGFDRYINYYKIQYATLCIRENPGCMFIATNRDAVTHLTDAQVRRGTGARGLAWGAAPAEQAAAGPHCAVSIRAFIQPHAYAYEYCTPHTTFTSSQTNGIDCCLVVKPCRTQQRLRDYRQYAVVTRLITEDADAVCCCV